MQRGDIVKWTHGNLENLRTVTERVVLHEKQGPAGYMVKSERDGQFHYAWTGQLAEV